MKWTKGSMAHCAEVHTKSNGNSNCNTRAAALRNEVD
jgi:hypothetical protein